MSGTTIRLDFGYHDLPGWQSGRRRRPKRKRARKKWDRLMRELEAGAPRLPEGWRFGFGEDAVVRFPGTGGAE